MKQAIAIICFLLGACAAMAQTSTPTPTATPTNIPAVCRGSGFPAWHFQQGDWTEDYVLTADANGCAQFEAAAAASSVSFDNVTTQTNTSETLTCGTGCSITTSGSGSINATNINCSGCVGDTQTGGVYVKGAVTNGGLRLSSQQLGLKNCDPGELIYDTGTNTWDCSAVTVDGAGTITGALSGNATTATALAANGANCSAGQAARGVDASGAAEDCFTPSVGSVAFSGITTDTNTTATMTVGTGGSLTTSGSGTITATSSSGLACTDCVALGTETTGTYVDGVITNGGLQISGTEGADLGLIDCTTDATVWDTGTNTWACNNNVLADSTGNFTANSYAMDADDTDPTCSTSDDYNVFADLSETNLKKCVAGNKSDLDTRPVVLVATTSSTIGGSAVTTTAKYLGLPSTQSALAATEANAQRSAVGDLECTKLYARSQAGLASSELVTVTLRDDGADTALSCGIDGDDAHTDCAFTDDVSTKCCRDIETTPVSISEASALSVSWVCSGAGCNTGNDFWHVQILCNIAE